MENLLCNEVWLMSPNILLDNTNVQEKDEPHKVDFWTEEDCEEALSVFIGKEDDYSPERGYSELVVNDDLIRNARFKAVNWLIKFLEFKHCVVATSAVRSTVEHLLPSTKMAPLANIEAFIPQDHKDDLIKCRRMIAKLMVQDHERFVRVKNYWHGPLSPVTVLKVDLFELKSGRKRK
ncbi:DNA repair protein RecO, partial [Striga asiatica]